MGAFVELKQTDKDYSLYLNRARELGEKAHEVYAQNSAEAGEGNVAFLSEPLAYFAYPVKTLKALVEGKLKDEGTRDGIQIIKPSYVGVSAPYEGVELGAVPRKDFYLHTDHHDVKNVTLMYRQTIVFAKGSKDEVLDVLSIQNAPEDLALVISDFNGDGELDFATLAQDKTMHLFLFDPKAATEHGPVRSVTVE